MRILFCCELYAPSVGGVQEVIRQIAERLVVRGHEVTVATSKLSARDAHSLNGVNIAAFEVAGNMVCGMTGELSAYRDFVTSGQFDVVVVKAAQQWSFDALWDVLPRIKARKVLIPCGFSALHDPAYNDYFSRMPNILRQFDHLIFYASDYRDINFARAHGISNFSIVPNGASEVEFSADPDITFRERHGIAADEVLFLTVGTFTGIKGHLEVVQAYEHVSLAAASTLILNGNSVSRITTTLHSKVKAHVRSTLRGLKVLRDPWLEVARRINQEQANKKVLITDLPRPELVQAYIAADLFVFASNIEYSPLVLFESVAAGTPFLSVPVGNAEEIALWTEAGVICPAEQDVRGYTRVDPVILGDFMARLASNRDYLVELGTAGKKNWLERFTWDKISLEYERILMG
jgi:glycosyltransferase involved in cell wall biosynthesis